MRVDAMPAITISRLVVKARGLDFEIGDGAEGAFSAALVETGVDIGSNQGTSTC